MYIKSCFISYAWNTESKIKLFTKYLFDILKLCEIEARLDMKDNSAPGSDINSFIDNINSVDCILVVISDEYLKKIENPKTRVFQEWQLIKEAIGNGNMVIPILYDIINSDVLPKELNNLVTISGYSREEIIKLVETINPDKKLEKLRLEGIKSYSDYIKISSSNYEYVNSENLQQFAIAYANIIYPNVVWLANDFSNEVAKIDESTFIKIFNIYDEIDYNSNLSLETVYLEGYFDDTLRSILIVTNGYFSPKFKYMALTRFEKNCKTIHFIDRNDIVNIFGISENNLFSKNNIMFPVAISFRIQAIQFIESKDYNYLHSGLIDRSEIISIEREFTKSFMTVSNLYNNSIYYLYFYIYSSKESKLRIINNADLPFILVNKMNQNFDLHIKKGNNEILLLIKTNTVGTYNGLEIKIEDINDKCVHSSKLGFFKVVPFTLPKLHFEKQLNSIVEISNLINHNILSENNILVTIFGDGGTGKSYLLDTIVQDLSNRSCDSCDIFRIDFQYDNITNKKTIANLLFFLILQLPFDVSCDWIHTDRKIQSIMPPNALKLMKYLKKENQVNPVDIQDILIDCKDKGGLLYPNKHYLRRKIVFIDDIHKLSDESLLAFKFVLNFFLKNSNKTSFILSGRSSEIDPTDIIYLRNESACSHNLTYPSYKDIIKSIGETNYLLKNYADKSFIDNSYEGTVFTVYDFVKSICCQNIHSQYEFNRKIIETRDNIKSHKYLSNRFNNLQERDKALLNIIYICKIEAIDLHVDELADETPLHYDIENLIERELIAIKSNLLIPRHDLLLESYKPYYDYQTARFFENKYEMAKENDTKEKILKILITAEWHSKQKYFDIAYELLNNLFENKEYYKSLSIAKKMVQIIESDSTKVAVSNYKKAYIQFMYATTLNHCGSLYKSQIGFEGVSRYEYDEDEMTIGLVYEAESEKLSLDYWLLRTNNLTVNLEKLQKKIRFSDIRNIHQEKALLNTFNRLMVTNLLLDNYSEAKVYFEKSLEYANTLNHPEYNGYANMDYAKGLYNIAPREALKYLGDALSIFEKLDESRRMLDCECEIYFLQLVLGITKESHNLIEVSKKLKDKGLYNLYAKSMIKLAAIKLRNDIEYADSLIDVFSKYTAYNNDLRDPRKELIILNLDIIQQRILNKESYISNDERYSYESDIGDSYLDIINNNKVITKNCSTIKWAHESKYDNTDYILDLRIW